MSEVGFYGRCGCGGVFAPHEVQVTMRATEPPLVLEQVPQAVCPLCDARVYKAFVLEGLEHAFRGRAARPQHTLLTRTPAERSA
jgi:hypothetical protein